MRVALVMTVTLLAACTEERERGRETAGGGWRAACQTTNDCGCRDRGVDDPFCEGTQTTQLQCLSSSKICTLSCQTSTDCAALFGTSSRCDSIANVCINQ